MRKIFKDIDESLWNSWKWQLQNRITNVYELQKHIKLSEEEKIAIEKVDPIYPFSVTPYYLSLVNDEDQNDPIKAQIIPKLEEIDEEAQKEADDNPFNEESKIPGLTHRYKDRVLLSVISFCGVYCRHCMRKRIFKESQRARTKEELDIMFDYIKDHKEIKDVLISGGEPLNLDNEKIEYILKNLRKISHVEIIRFGTRAPVTLPQRLYDKDLLKLFEKYSPIWVNTHFNHPNEITEESAKAIDNILKSGTPVNNQTVLLKGINDDKDIILSLMRKLLQIKVKPQYLFYCDPVKGAIHFRTPLEKGLEIIDYLRGKISGMGIPTYAIDLPGGKGKVPLLKPYYKKGKDFYTFKDFSGNEVEYKID